MWQFLGGGVLEFRTVNVCKDFIFLNQLLNKAESLHSHPNTTLLQRGSIWHHPNTSEPGYNFETFAFALARQSHLLAYSKEKLVRMW